MSLTGSADFHVSDIFEVKGSLNAFADAPSKDFGGSSISYNWGDGDLTIRPYQDASGHLLGIPLARRAHAAAAGGSFTVPARAPTTSVTVHGAGGAPSVSLIGPDGQAVTFAQQTNGLLHVIGRVRGTSGTVPFRPAFGPAGRRQLIARITQNGLPYRKTLGSFSVPPPALPGRARRLRVQAGRRTFSFRFVPPATPCTRWCGSSPPTGASCSGSFGPRYAADRPGDRLPRRHHGHRGRPTRRRRSRSEHQGKRAKRTEDRPEAGQIAQASTAGGLTPTDEPKD